ncbi:MAG: hypothetical protein ACKO5R_09545, partial [Planctomycetaceae bacterium]
MRSLQRRASIVPGCLALLLFPAAGANPPAVPATGVGPPAVPAAGVGPPAVPGIEPPPPPREPRVAAASDEAGAARGALALPEGFVAELWAAEPDLANPVAFSIDERGRVYVCEAFRAHKGVGDNVRINDERWLDADLANDTVDERFESMLRLLGDRAAEWVVETDRLRRLVDADGGDRTRLVHVMAGGDSGWRGPVQYLPDRGPFNREQLWRTPFEGQAAWVLPPVGHVGAGPAGFAAYPGTGLTPWFAGRFFLADFRGTAATSLVHTFRIRPRGASFEMADHDETFRHVLATDVEVGPDGALWVSDWVQGWEGEGKGRLWRFLPAARDTARDAVVAEVRGLLGGDWITRDAEALRALLGHADRRVRREAQFELVRRGDGARLAAVARGEAPRLAKVHALEGLGQILRAAARADRTTAEALPAILAATADADADVRTVATRVAGEGADPTAAAAVLERLDDPHPHVRAAAGLALARLAAAGAIAGPPGGAGQPGRAVERVVRRARSGDDVDDPWLRHALVMALAALADGADRACLAADDHPGVRLLACLAMRRARDPAIAAFLRGGDGRLALEAARAIYDLPVPGALGDLAAALDHLDPSGPDGDALARRAIAANERVGTPVAAARLAAFLARAEVPRGARLQAIDVLARWADPPPRDRVWGAWRPIGPRDPAPARLALAAVLDLILDPASPAGADEAVAGGALAAAASL